MTHRNPRDCAMTDAALGSRRATWEINMRSVVAQCIKEALMKVELQDWKVQRVKQRAALETLVIL